MAPADAERGRFGDAAPLRRGPDADDAWFVLEHLPDGAGVDIPEFGQLWYSEVRLKGGRCGGFRARFLHGTS